ncbi:hypothetical protein C2857_006188 [Epichloe festucae Fl1]|uniref:Thioredoxin-like fold protein n=1 Tax=Epichloe festucae (strain Fl1) TaxID=877507 RepID=A0A7S9KPY3_EPIFF|nr:hypothetical protein C2857_006188 [Epichloe festucae Fl1]
MTTYSTDPALYIYTSLTAGSSHIVTATSRLETILRANRVPFKAIDVATDEKARMLWGRRAGKDDGGRLRKLPGLVQEGLVLGDLVEIEDWNEYGELKQHVKIYYDEHTIPNIHNKPPEPKKPQNPAAKPAAKPAAATDTPVAASKTTPAAPPAPPPLPEPPKSLPPGSSTAKTGDKPPGAGKQTALPMRSVADEAAQKAKELRLKSLREKVHGKKPDGDGDSSTSSKTTADGDASDPAEKAAADEDRTPAGLQSPTSGAWKNKSGKESIPETAQSPTSGKWRPGSISGAATAAVSKEGVEKCEGAPNFEKKKAGEKTEVPNKEDDDDDDDDDDDESEEDESEDDGQEETKDEDPKTAGSKDEDGTEEKTGNAQSK